MAGSFSFRAYDANSNVVSTRDPNGLGQDCTFDALNRDVTCADLQEQADGVDRYKLYNAASQVISSADAQGNVTTQSYDARNRLVSTTDPNQIVVDYTYDANSNLTSLNDGNGNTRTWEYNARNLKSRKTNPTPNDVLDYAYDALRRLTLKIDQDNHHHISEYDMASRLEKRVYKTGGTITESEDTFTYDGASRLLSSTKGRYNVTTAHTYAADSSPLSETISYQGKTYTTARTYDAANRPISQTFQDGKVQTWVYDARNLVASSSYEGESIFTQTQDDGYRLTHQTLGNGLTHSITYGRSDHLRTFDFVLDGTQSIEDLELSYSYAVDKQITAETVAGGVMQDASFTASYDSGNRVTGWNRTGAIDTNSPESQSWNYDDAGNWTSTTIDGTVQNRSHNDDNELTAVAGNNTALDDRGNLTEDDQGNVYIYDLDNRLKRVELDNNTDVDMVYDALGRRVLIDNGSDETFFTWWGDQEVAEHEHNSTQSTVQNDLWAHPTALNTIIARAVEGSKFKMEWYHKNYLDHVYAVSDDSGDILEHYRYNAFGEVEVYNTSENELATGAIDNKVTWNSRRYDSDTKLHYYKYRHYNPALGRWLSRDPIEEEGGVNLYGFVGNDVVNKTDVFGLWKRVKGSSHTWCAEEGDTLSSLASKGEYGGNAANWSCLWPTNDTQDHGYPNTIQPGDKYDATNLVTPCSENKLHITTHGERLRRGQEGAYGITLTRVPPSEIAEKIRTASGEGSSPISYMFLGGHGIFMNGISLGIGSSSAQFATGDLLALEKKPTFVRAQNMNGPVRCWFCRDSIVRFTACKSYILAQSFARKVLRRGASSWGTRHTIRHNYISGNRNFPDGYYLEYEDVNGNVVKTRVGASIYSKTWVRYHGEL
ncbi:RHS repeat domain-containing protein [Rubritalea tangerina]|uniref:RHS repeat domain-containing protein n=2 Tax=Rubritalea tangerina TaxID=430798 RepID=A0ABW4ZF23_9BACT